MDWAALGLSRDPFERNPELDDACLPNTMAALLSELLASLRSAQGVSVLVADAGSGKSVAAAAFARRAASVTHVATLVRPASSVSAIAREALVQFDSTDFDFSIEEDWVAALRARVERCARAGRATAILIDDAHRLSPQTLDDLAAVFGEDESLRLHVFLFGRPRLLDRMEAVADGALDSHVLQVCRLEPLGVRESVRYLERRLAISGGELTALFTDEAIDEIVQTSEGRILRLEEVAAEALRRATRRGQLRAGVEDVVATARRAVTDEEEPMAVHQQPLKFQLTDEESEDEAVDWDDGGERDERVVEWGDEDDGDDEEWEAEDGEDSEPLTWDTSPDRLDAMEPDEDLEDEYDDLTAADATPAASARRRLVGPAVLSVTAALALVWAANHVPGPASGERHGRDATLFAQPLSSDPAQIMRLATTVEAADADAQVIAWRAQPPRPVEVEKAVEVPEPSEVAREDAPAQAEHARPAVERYDEGVDAEAAAVGPPAPAAAAGVATERPATVPTIAKSTASAVARTKPAVAPAASKKVASAKKGPVFTVQLGAFKARRNAEELVNKLRGKPTHILQEGGLYRVMSGSFANKRDAVVHEASLKRAGYTTYVRTAVF